MPRAVFRVKGTEEGEKKEVRYWTKNQAFLCKYDIDYYYGKQEYLNFERCYAYREYVQLRLVMSITREQGWWYSPRPRVLRGR
jgi:hypothetical protein